MFGVVLWSDADEHKAVIWCEDHGDLAFYRPTEALGDISLDPGDLVQFDMIMDRHLRFAQNPRLVTEGVCADLAGALEQVHTDDAPAAATGRGSARIIPFSPACKASRGPAARGPDAKLA